MIGRIKEVNKVAENTCTKKVYRYLNLCLLVCLLNFCFVFSARAEEGLVLHYTFDEGSGSTAYDKSTKKNNGKIYGAEYVKPEKGYALKGYALKFDGKANYVDCGNKRSLNMETGDFSIEFWGSLGKLSGGTKVIVGKRGGSWGSSSAGYEIVGDSQIWMYIGDGTANPGQIARTTTNFSNTGWHHVVFTLDRDGNAESYVDSIHEGTTDISGAQGSVSNKLNLTIMRRSGWGYHVPGTIDEVRIYKRVLSEEEIKGLFKKKFDEKISSLKQILAEKEKELRAILPAADKEIKKKAEEIVSSLKQKVHKAEWRGIIYPFEQEEIGESMRQLERIISGIKNLS